MYLLVLSGCMTPQEQAAANAAAIAEQQRRASLTPRQACQEDANKEHNRCNLKCTLGNWGNTNAKTTCEGQCNQNKLIAYQICGSR